MLKQIWGKIFGEKLESESKPIPPELQELFDNKDNPPKLEYTIKKTTPYSILEITTHEEGVMYFPKYEKKFIKLVKGFYITGSDSEIGILYSDNMSMAEEHLRRIKKQIESAKNILINL